MINRYMFKIQKKREFNLFEFCFIKFIFVEEYFFRLLVFEFAMFEANKLSTKLYEENTSRQTNLLTRDLLW